MEYASKLWSIRLGQEPPHEEEEVLKHVYLPSFAVLEVLCLFCTFKAYRKMHGCPQSQLLNTLYLSINTTLIARIVYSLYPYIEIDHMYICGMQQFIELGKDIFAFALIGRFYEVIAEVVSRYQRRYTCWKSVVWAMLYVHIAVYLVLWALFTFKDWTLELTYYDLGAASILLVMWFYVALRYLYVFKSTLPELYVSKRLFILILLFVMAIMQGDRIAYYAQYADIFTKQKIEGLAQRVQYPLKLLLTELLPFSTMLLYLLCEFNKKAMNLLSIGSFISFHDYIDASDLSDAGVN